MLEACAPHAEQLGCSAELARVPELAAEGSDGRQRRLADERGGLGGLVEALADEFVAAPPATGHS
jgi:hypothetical protein